MQQLLPFIEINSQVTPTASVICMHGLGANGQDLAGLVPQLNLPPNHSIRFIFPNAPVASGYIKWRLSYAVLV